MTIEARKIRRARIAEERNEYTIFVMKPEGKALVNTVMNLRVS
jgi:hypothetical protein